MPGQCATFINVNSILSTRAPFRSTTVVYEFHSLERNTAKSTSGDKRTVTARSNDTKTDKSKVQVLPGHDAEDLKQMQSASFSATTSLVTVIFAAVVIYLW